MVKIISPWLTLVASFLETPHIQDEYILIYASIAVHVYHMVEIMKNICAHVNASANIKCSAVSNITLTRLHHECSYCHFG